VDWMYLAHDRDQEQALLNTVIDFWVAQKMRNFLLAELSLALQGLCSMELVGQSVSDMH
jgi:Tfp pilus assembly ATPase PilU